MSNMRCNDPKWLGKKYNHLTVVGFTYAHNRWLWECDCDCGGHTLAWPNLVVRGHVKACHCGKSRTFREMNTTHGFSKERLYEIWCSMKKRCNNPNSKGYSHYGGRGIRICEEWSNDYVTFRDWALSHGYSDELSIERIDVNGNYCPENCKWIPLKEQALNRTRTILVTIDGETKPFSKWMEYYGLNKSTAYSRYYRGETPEQALDNSIKRESCIKRASAQ